jgi:hypothetical protein
MAKQKPNLANALAESGQSRRRAPEQPAQETVESQDSATAPVRGQAPSRQGTRPITGHFPKNVRDQLKILAVERDQTVQGLLAEALNDLFAKYGKAELAPRPDRDSRS